MKIIFILVSKKYSIKTMEFGQPRNLLLIVQFKRKFTGNPDRCRGFGNYVFWE